MWKYEGQAGEFLAGIPARDISDEEAREREIEPALKASRIYRHVPEREEKKRSED